MIKDVELPVPEAWGFAEFARRHGDFAVVSVVAAQFGDRVRIVVGGVVGVPHLVDAGDLAIVDGELFDDLHGSAGYRRALTEQMTARALADLAARPRPVREPG